MRKHYLILAALAAVMTVLSCQKDPKEEPATPEKPDTPDVEKVYSLDATAPADAVAVDGTKTTMVSAGVDTYAVNWAETDVIRVNGTASTAISVNTSDPKKASFSFDSGVTAPYKSIYPSAAYKSEGVITLPASQTYKAGTFDPAAAIMAGYSESGSLAFSHLMAYLLITPENKSGENIKSITLRSRGTEPMSGDFNVSFTPSVSMTAAASDGAAVTLNCGEGIAPETPVVIAIPAQTYASGFTVTVTDATDRTTTLASKNEFPATAGKVYRTALDVSEVGIWSEADFEAFAAAANAGDYSAWVGSDGDVDLFVDITRENNLPQVKNFDGIFEGNGHSISIANKTLPLFGTIEAGAKVQNLTTGGTITGFAENGVCAYSSLARINLGTIYKCTNKTDGANVGLIDGTAVVFGGFVGQNGGTMEECVNEGNIYVKLKSAAWRGLACFGGGLAAYGHTVIGYTSADVLNVNSTCVAGKFIKCTNKGNITVEITAGTIQRAAFGGICGMIIMNGVEFDGCSNEGTIKRFSNGEDNPGADAATSIGGILGRSAAWFKGNIEALDSDGSSLGGFNTVVKNCTNSGTIIQAHRSDVNFGSGSDNRRDYAGGIVGILVGKTGSIPQINNCTLASEGKVLCGFNNNNSSHVEGGIVGATANATLSGNNVYGEIGSNGTNVVGAAGGVVGYVISNTSIADGIVKPILTPRKSGSFQLSYGLIVASTKANGQPIVSGCQVGGSITLTGVDQGLNSTNYDTHLCKNNHNSNVPNFSSISWAD